MNAVKPLHQMELTPAASVYTKYCIPKSLMRHICNQIWTIPSQYKDLFSEYFLLYWRGSYFKHTLQDGIIKHGNISFHVIYQNCNYVDVCAADQIKLSFRKPIDEYGMPGIVIVRIQQQ